MKTIMDWKLVLEQSMNHSDSSSSSSLYDPVEDEEGKAYRIEFWKRDVFEESNKSNV